MHYPLIERHLLADLRLVHAAFNAGVMVLFFYLAWLGLSIRRARKNQAPLPVPRIKRHRTMGPILAILGAIGFFVGLALVLLRTGDVLEYPLHLYFGLAIVVSLFTTFMVSRKIKGPDSPYRTPHFMLGLAILVLYLIEVFLGLGVLL